MTPTTPPWISIVIPIKDEIDNLQPFTHQLLTFLQQREESHTSPFEIIYINDGSADGSGDVLDRLSHTHSDVRVWHFDKNYGKTAALLAGFARAQGLLIATLDGDLQNDPADLGTLLPYTDQFDLVTGRRRKRNDSLIRTCSSRLAFWVRNGILQDGIYDTACALKIFRRGVIEHIPPFEGMHRFFPALAQMYGFTVTEVFVSHFPRLHGHSKYGVWNRLFTGLYDLMAVRWMQKRCVQYKMKHLTDSTEK